MILERDTIIEKKVGARSFIKVPEFNSPIINLSHKSILGDFPKYEWALANFCEPENMKELLGYIPIVYEGYLPPKHRDVRHKEEWFRYVIIVASDGDKALLSVCYDLGTDTVIYNS